MNFLLGGSFMSEVLTGVSQLLRITDQILDEFLKILEEIRKSNVENREVRRFMDAMSRSAGSENPEVLIMEVSGKYPEMDLQSLQNTLERHGVVAHAKIDKQYLDPETNEQHIAGKLAFYTKDRELVEKALSFVSFDSRENFPNIDLREVHDFLSVNDIQHSIISDKQTFDSGLNAFKNEGQLLFREIDLERVKDSILELAARQHKRTRVPLKELASIINKDGAGLHKSRSLTNAEVLGLQSISKTNGRSFVFVPTFSKKLLILKININRRMVRGI